jgi:replicative DNA helicase
MHARGEAVDPIAVADRLLKNGQLTKIGGAPYLSELYSTPITTSNAAYYARIVRDRATLRRLHAATRIAQLAQTAEGDTADIVETAREEWGYLSGADQQRGREPVATTDSDARTRASLGYVVLRRGVTDWMQVEPSAGHGRGTAR